MKRKHKNIRIAALLTLPLVLSAALLLAAYHHYPGLKNRLSAWYHHYLAPPPSLPNFSAFNKLSYGIDLSHHQGVIHWKTLKNQGAIRGHPIRFVFLKATEGKSFKDRHFKHNWNKAKHMGFLCGAYHFYDPHTASSLQFNNFKNSVHLSTGDLPPVLDVESRGNLSHRTFNRGVLNMLKLLENEYGVKPIIYSSPSFYSINLTHKEFKKYPLWISYYGKKLPRRFRNRWVFWQYSNRVRVKGIKGLVDANVFNGNKIKLLSLLIQ